MGVDIAGVLFAVGLFGGVAPLEEEIVEFGDAAGAGLAFVSHVGLEVGCFRLFRLGWGSFPSCVQSIHLWRCFAIPRSMLTAV